MTDIVAAIIMKENMAGITMDVMKDMNIVVDLCIASDAGK